MPGPIIQKPSLPYWADPQTESVTDPLYQRLIKRAMGISGMDDPNTIMGVGGPKIPEIEHGPLTRPAQTLVDLLEGLKAENLTTKGAARISALGPAATNVTGFRVPPPAPPYRVPGEITRKLRMNKNVKVETPNVPMKRSPDIERRWQQQVAADSKLKQTKPTITGLPPGFRTHKDRATAKLTAEIVKEMRTALASGVPRKEILEKYRGLASDSTLVGALRGDTWGHIK